ncbi:MAG: tRNA preQ1(34) S-adenosylmethionine ribosyltransferase-isomerase QueA [bacterium]|nr:tRNA preQ1(34) S-adenosylmethionine ribosyltransferase-isomerase QueA [bacterium]
MRLDQFDYHFSKKLIAQKSASPRDACRLMVIDHTKKSIEHHRFHDIEKNLHKGDVLVLNDSKVIPARLLGTKNTGGKTELFLVRQTGTSTWTALLKNFKQAEIGKTISIGTKKTFIAEPLRIISEGLWEISFNKKGAELIARIRRYGKTPTPPYIKKVSSLKDYQTVYAKHEGSVAAPTAGFHFTPRLIRTLKKKGVSFQYVTLHVGPGTFSPVRSETIEKHTMHGELALLDSKTAKTLTSAKKRGQRIIAVGTTSVRVLESFCDKNGMFYAGKKDLNLFIYPGYTFKAVEGLITNFHLPKSTLLILVCAFTEWKTKGGMQKILEAYQEAVRKKYQFYSFGDAMMII